MAHVLLLLCRLPEIYHRCVFGQIFLIVLLLFHYVSCSMMEAFKNYKPTEINNNCYNKLFPVLIISHFSCYDSAFPKVC